MKAIYVDKNGVPIAISPDSAIIPNRRPWFIPDFGGEWSGLYLLAVRIGRLGKGIKPEFVHRYVDAATVAVHPLPGADNVPDVISYSMDGALILGDWMELSRMPFSVGEPDRCLLAADSAMVHSAVSVCSRHMTLKTGDVILIPAGCGVRLLTHNLKLAAFDVTAAQILDVNVK